MSAHPFEIVLFGGASVAQGYCKTTGLFRLATELRDHGYTVQCIDGLRFLTELPDEELDAVLAKYLSERTLLIGVSTTLMLAEGSGLFFGLPAGGMGKFLKRLKRVAPNAKVVFGGPQVTEGTARYFHGTKRTDYCVTGQGERALLAIANHLKFGDPLTYREDGALRWVSDKTYPYDDFPSSRIRWETNDLVERGEVLPMEVARGCVFKCAFCSYALIGKKWGDMMRDLEVMRADLMRNYELYGTTHYLITDDTINDSIEKVRALHALFTSLPFQIQWCSYARLDIIWKHPEMAQLLLEAGMRGVVFGIETMHELAGKYVGKGLGAERTKETLRHCRKVWGDRIHINSGFILGLPNEPVEHMRETHEWIRDGDLIDWPTYHPFVMQSIAGDSKISADMAKYGYRLPEDSAFGWVSEHGDYWMMKQLKVQWQDEMRAHRKVVAHVGSAWSMFRLINIGFSIDDQHQIEHRDPTFRKQRVKRRKQRHRLYVKRLLEWQPATPIEIKTERVSPAIAPKPN